ncbi:hypothetical protein [Clostridium butyricum]|nr:hypothetical protein [Clostridium butyricum]ALR90229.1 hypothetical protein ATN24_17345 [Clostridium butyricum]ALS19114.1 hypothetical protein ATD26_19800 [Clostridium butyricum]ANF16301.1 hypothetical protein AZ909_19835 [Clostridium butyricum]AOR96213.1 hypothetical protein BBB49_19305 [Clostridium butyricum]MCI3010244.1 hypothetical protein [Clostridium butyricum]
MQKVSSKKVMIIKDKLILASFLSNLFYAACYPAVHSFLMQSVGQRMISLNSICTCAGGIIMSFFWNKYSDKLYKKYGLMLTIEAVIYILLLIMLISYRMNLLAYYILDTLCFSLLTKNIICGGNKLRAKRYDSEIKRTEYDNNSQIAGNISSMIGFFLSAVFEFNMSQAFVLSTIGICIDNIFYYSAWKE